MQPVVLHTRKSRFAFALAAFVALISAAVSPAAAQSASPPFHPKPHPGVPLVVPDPPVVPSADPDKPVGKGASPSAGPGAVPPKSTAHRSSTPHTTASTAHPAKASRSHSVIAQVTAPSGGTAKPSGAPPAPHAEQLPAQLAGAAVPQTGTFAVSQLGHSVGTASFQFARTAAGYDSTSTVQVSMQGLDYALSKNEELDPARHILHVVLSATVNGQAVYATGRPDAAQFLLNMSANGRSSTTRLPGHLAAVLLADFDPGGLETLLMVAAAQNGRDLWAILPKRAGSIEAVQLATYADESGTLDGKPITVHHLVATIADAASDLFSGPGNQLLQAELPQQGFSLIRKGFVLTPPKRPVMPTE